MTNQISFQPMMESRPIREIAYEVLKHAIISGEIPAGGRIVETEAYCGESDTACHAHHGRTKRTEMLYRRGGHVYVYLCYGIHSLLNIITGEEDDPQGVLIRCCAGAAGPGKLTKRLGIDLSFNGLDMLTTDRISLWQGPECAYDTAPRVGIGYASEEDQARLWRFIRKGN